MKYFTSSELFTDDLIRRCYEKLGKVNPLNIEVTDTEVRVSGIACGTQVWPIYEYSNHFYSMKIIDITNHRNGVKESVVVQLTGDYPERIIKAYSFLGIE